MIKELSYVILEPHNVRMEPSNVRKKIREPTNIRKKLLHVMLKLHNMRIEPSNVGKKIREPPNVKRTITCDVGNAQCKDETIKREKKVREP